MTRRIEGRVIQALSPADRRPSSLIDRLFVHDYLRLAEPVESFAAGAYVLVVRTGAPADNSLSARLSRQFGIGDHAYEEWAPTVIWDENRVPREGTSVDIEAERHELGTEVVFTPT